MPLKQTSSTNNLRGSQKGSFNGLRKNHHDRTNENETNKDIKSNLSYLNDYEKHVDDIEEFYEVEQEGRIKERNKKNAKYADRQFDDYDSYLKYKQSASKSKKYPHTPEWDYLRTYAEKEDMEELEEDFKQMGVTQEELRLTILEGQKRANQNFNKRYDGHIKILQTSYHLDEATCHNHNQLIAYGEVGKEGSKNPVTNFNQSLEKYYGRYQTDERGNEVEFRVEKGKNAGKMVKKKLSDKERWEMFHDTNDRDQHECVSEKLRELARSKGYPNYEPPEFVRREAEKTGIDHDIYKESKRKAAEDNRKAILEGVKKEAEALDDYSYEVGIKEMKANKVIRGVEKLEKEKQEFEEEKAKFEERKTELDEKEKNLKDFETKVLEYDRNVGLLNQRIDAFEEEKRISEYNKSNFAKAGRMMYERNPEAFEAQVRAYNSTKKSKSTKGLKIPLKTSQKSRERDGMDL